MSCTVAQLKGQQPSRNAGVFCFLFWSSLQDQFSTEVSHPQPESMLGNTSSVFPNHASTRRLSVNDCRKNAKPGGKRGEKHL